MRKLRLVYWNNIPTPYMVDRFNALADRDTYEFEAWFSARTEPGRSWAVDESTWRFPYRYLHGVGMGQFRLELPIRLLGAKRPDVLVSLYASPSYVIGSTLARFRGTRIAYWVEVTFDAWTPRRRWKEALKRWLFPRAHGILTPGGDGRAFAERYGAPRGRIHRVPHAIDVDRFRVGAEDARPDRAALRERLGLEGCTFIYVGRLWEHGKGLGHLIDAFAAIATGDTRPLSLLLVGDGPDESRLRRRARAEGVGDAVKFAGFVPSAELPRYYAASDVFVFPTIGDPYGLVLDEAMAASLPVISTSAAGELGERVQHGHNGLLVPPADTAALAEAMLQMASDSAKRVAMGQESAGNVRGRTPEAWAQALEGAIGSILGSVCEARRGS